MVEQAGEGDAAEVGHAEQVESGGWVDAVGEDGDDVGVLEAGESLGFVGTAAGDFDDDGAIGEAAFSGAEDPGQAAAAQLFLEQEAADGLSGLGQGGSGVVASSSEEGAGGGADQLMDGQEPGQGGGEAGEAAEVFGGVGLFAGFFAEAVILVEQTDADGVIEPGVAVEQVGCGAALSGLAAEAQLAAEDGEPVGGLVASLAAEEAGGGDGAAASLAPVGFEPSGKGFGFGALRLVPDDGVAELGRGVHARRPAQGNDRAEEGGDDDSSRRRGEARRGGGGGLPGRAGRCVR